MSGFPACRYCDGPYDGPHKPRCRFYLGADATAGDELRQAQEWAEKHPDGSVEISCALLVRLAARRDDAAERDEPARLRGIINQLHTVILRRLRDVFKRTRADAQGIKPKIEMSKEWCLAAAHREAEADLEWSVVRLRSALENWGRHFDWCALRDNGSLPCSCGLTEMLAAYAARSAAHGSE